MKRHQVTVTPRFWYPWEQQIVYRLANAFSSYLLPASSLDRMHFAP